MPTKYLLFALPILPALFGQASGDVKLDTPQVRVFVFTENPHQPDSPHDFPMSGGLVFFGSGQAAIKSQSGGTEAITFRPGDFHWIPAAQAVVIENTGDQPFQVAEIELKSKPQGPLPETALDPVKVDPKRYQVEFENQQAAAGGSTRHCE